MILFGHALRSSRVDYQVAALPVVTLFFLYEFRIYIYICKGWRRGIGPTSGVELDSVSCREVFLLRDTAKAGSPFARLVAPSYNRTSFLFFLINIRTDNWPAKSRCCCRQVTDFGRVRPAEGGVLRQVNAALFVSPVDSAAEIQKRDRYEDK